MQKLRYPKYKKTVVAEFLQIYDINYATLNQV